MSKVLLVLIMNSVTLTFCAEWTDASWSDYPYMAVLDVTKSGGTSRCGGSILSNSECGRGAILTAAHCVDGATNIKVGIGCTKSDCTESGATWYDAYPNYAIHPDYDPTLSTSHPYWLDNDVAVIFIPVIDSKYNAETISLHSDISVLQNNDNLRVFGYFGTGSSDTDTLEYADTHYMISSECEAILGWKVKGGHDFCIKDDDTSNGVQTVCYGDSGSPLIFENKQIGLNSWLVSGCNPNYPTVATSIPYYYQWITNTVANCQASLNLGPEMSPFEERPNEVHKPIDGGYYIEISKPIFLAIAGLIASVIVMNLIIVCYINKNKAEIKGYGVVKHGDSDSEYV